VQRALRAVQDPSRARPAPVPPGRALQAAIVDSLTALLVEAEALAEDDIVDRWGADPAGRPLLAGNLGEASGADVAGAAARAAVRDWQQWLKHEVRLAAPTVRTRTRGTTTAATAVLATVAALAPPVAEVPTVGTAAEALCRVLAEPSIAGFAAQARAELSRRLAEHFESQQRAWLARVEARRIDAELAARLRQAATDVGVARQLALVLGKAA
jgi:hypothetical protein